MSNTVPTPAEATAAPTLKLARTSSAVRGSVLREVMGLALRPGVLSFAHGLPPTDLLPGEALARATARLLPDQPKHLQYGIPSAGLKAHVAELMRRRGAPTPPERIFLTTGAQQALSLLAHLLVDPGDRVLVEEAVYDGILMAVRPLGPRFVTVPTDLHEGIDVDAVEAAFADPEARPALAYLIPEGHNPLGVSLSAAQRRRLVEAAARHGVPLVEDDAYGFLRYGETDAPPLVSLDPRWVFYVGSFSKVLSPALRVGWLVVPEELLPRLEALKHGIDIDTNTLSQGLVESFLDTGAMPAHLERLRDEYRSRRDRVLAALETHFRAAGASPYLGAIRWNRPEAGMFLWMELPEPVDMMAALRDGVEKDLVAWSPGLAFRVNPGTAPDAHLDRHLRLSFTSLPMEGLDEGVRRLARALSRLG